MSKLIFINLPVADLPKATAFYESIGARKNPQFSDGTTSCIVFSDTIYAMLLTHDRFQPVHHQEDRGRHVECASADLYLG